MYISELRDGNLIQTEVLDVSFDREVDVIVAGLGTSGAYAAMFAAENGLSVLGIETGTCVGGTATAGCIDGHYFGYFNGRYAKKDTEIKKEYRDRFCTKFEMDKLAIEIEMKKSGVEMWLQSIICGVYIDGKTLCGAKVFNGEKFINVKSFCLMDCTGDAIISTMAGCETEYGRSWDGQVQPYSMVSVVYDGEIYKSTNVDFGRVDQYDEKALSDAYIFSRAWELPEDRANNQFITHASLIGVREGKRIVSEETITIESLFENKPTKTPVFYSYADLDKHGWDIAFDGNALGDWAIGANLGAYNVTIPISYKTLIPKGFDGIVVPCRALGVDRDVSSCVRMMPDVKKAAEVAADMVYMAKNHKCRLVDIPYGELRDMLVESGCLNFDNNKGFRIDGVRDETGNIMPAVDVTFTNCPDDLKEKLSTQKPGEAIWAAKLMGEKAKATLLELLKDDDENTRKHAAFALAAIGCKEAVPQLVEMVISRDSTMLMDCRKHNNYRGCMAIYWLGRLGYGEITDQLISLITDENEVEKSVYNGEQTTTRYNISDFNGVYFQYLSNAVAALVRIGKANRDLKPKIAKAFKKAFSDNAYYKRITTRPEKSSEGNAAITIKIIALNAFENGK